MSIEYIAKKYLVEEFKERPPEMFDIVKQYFSYFIFLYKHINYLHVYYDMIFFYTIGNEFINQLTTNK